MTKTELTQLLKIAHPIIQAPMAGASTPELVAAFPMRVVLVPLAAQRLHPPNSAKWLSEFER